MSEKIVGLSDAVARFARERDWEQFHTPRNLAMGLSIEAAEVLEVFQWLTDEQARALSPDKVESLSDELADTFIYLLKLADAYRIDLVDAGHRKLAKNARKYPVAKAKGSAKKYDEL
jgi:NTP pyrophosphatase (non-canonical NTP hydrolase)